jgi:hypothetical protein
VEGERCETCEERGEGRAAKVVQVPAEARGAVEPGEEGRQVGVREVMCEVQAEDDVERLGESDGAGVRLQIADAGGGLGCGPGRGDGAGVEVDACQGDIAAGAAGPGMDAAQEGAVTAADVEDRETRPAGGDAVQGNRI